MNMLYEQLKTWSNDNGVVITPELVKPSDDGSEIFYCYGINDTHKMWFVQMQDNGCIYSVSIAPRNGVRDEFEYYASGASNDDFYPNRFVLRGPSRNMTVEETGQFIVELQKAQTMLFGVQRFFETGVHAFQYWAECAKDAIAKVRLGDYDLDGVEFTHDDAYTIAQRVVAGESLDIAVHQYLLETRALLDEGLDEIDDIDEEVL